MEATTNAAGFPRATSAANPGPESAAYARAVGATSASIAVIVASEASSTPLVALTRIDSGWMALAICVIAERAYREGIAITITDACATASDHESVSSTS